MDITQFFSEFSGAYFFSACLQANASVIAIIGVFWVFQIQSINSNIDSIKIALSMERGVSTDLGDLDPAIITIFEAKNAIERQMYIDNEVANNSAKSLLKSWKSKESVKAGLIQSVKAPTIIIAIALFIDAICLAFANLIHSLNPCVEFAIISSVLLYQFLIIATVVRSVFINISNKSK